MRVIAGKYRRRTLRSPPSMQVRPTSDRLRETLFGVLQTRLEACHFLDLCAGSGAVGIEALSRGAEYVTFVDRSRKMCGLIEENLDLCGVPEEDTTVVMSEAASFLRRTVQRGDEEWDIAFFDPPYAVDYTPVLEIFGTSALLRPKDGLLIVEHYHKKKLKEHMGNICLTRLLKQGDSCLSFYAVDK